MMPVNQILFMHIARGTYLMYNNSEQLTRFYSNVTNFSTFETFLKTFQKQKL